MGTHRYGYDANGNLVEGIVRGVGGTIEVGAHNRPRGWRLPNGSGQWRHNARGERVWVEARGGMGGVARLRERIVHDESGRRLETRRLQPDSVQSLIWLDQLPVAVVQDGVVHAIEADHLGTPRLARDLATGEVSWRWDFFGSAFGWHAAENRGLDLALRFPGQYHDPATGLHYNYFRDYDPSTGRYVQSDPVGLRGGVNTYAYVFGNPLGLVDPMGLAAQGSCCSRAMNAGLNRNAGDSSQTDRGFVACCDGKKFACYSVDSTRVTDQVAHFAIENCGRSHEFDHFEEVTCPRCGMSRPGRDNPNPGYAREQECSARRVQATCLEAALRQCTTVTCRSQVSGELNRIRSEMRDTYCGWP